jgi:hypothetical protein
MNKRNEHQSRGAMNFDGVLPTVECYSKYRGQQSVTYSGVLHTAEWMAIINSNHKKKMRSRFITVM